MNEFFENYQNPPVKFSSYGYHSMSSGKFYVDSEDFDVGQDFRTVERFKEYKEVGFDIFFMQNLTYRGEPFDTSELKRLMDGVQQAGLDKIIILDYRLTLLASRNESLIGGNDYSEKRVRFATDKEMTDYLPTVKFPTEKALEEYVRACMQEYIEHPAFYGLLLKDEPSYKCFKALGELKRTIEKVKKDTFIHINLLPMLEGPVALYAEEYESLEDAYEKYLTAFTDEVGLDYIQYDDYPMLETAGRSELGIYHLSSLQLTAEYCKKRGLKFYFVAQATSMKLRDRRVFRMLDKKDMLWQVGHILGFGVKRIAYFTYWRKAENVSGGEYFPDGTAMISQNGERTPVYYATKELHEDLREFSDVLMSFEYEKSGYSMRSVSRKIIEYLTRMENQPIDGMKVETQAKNSLFLFTQMENGKEKLYCVQNIEDPARSEMADKKTIKLRFENADIAYVFGFGGKREIVGNIVELTLSAGETAYILPKKEKTV